MSEPATTEAYPEGITERDHIAHDMRAGRFPNRSDVATFLAERDGASHQAAKMQGWATLKDGSRVQLSAGECDAIWAQVQAERAKRQADMPDEKAALRVMHDAFIRLKELGWREAVYCPKDGSIFDVIEAGSTGIFRGFYHGEWPAGHWIVSDGEDSYASRPVLFRLDPEAEAARQAKMAEAVARFRAEDSANAR